MTGISSPRRRLYLAEEYDLIERLDRLGLPPHRIGRLLDPPVSGDSVRNAANRAGIELAAAHRGRPSSADRERWRQIETSIAAKGGVW